MGGSRVLDGVYRNALRTERVCASTPVATVANDKPLLIGWICFSYLERFPVDGWTLFEPRTEYGRMGLPNERWRLSSVNADYTLCPTYPGTLVVPSAFSDEVGWWAAVQENTEKRGLLWDLRVVLGKADISSEKRGVGCAAQSTSSSIN